MGGLIGLVLIAIGGLIGILALNPVAISLLLCIVLMMGGVFLVILEMLGVFEVLDDRVMSLYIRDIQNLKGAQDEKC